MYDPVTGDSRIRFIVPKTSKSFPAGTYRLTVVNKVGQDTADFTVSAPAP